MQIEVTSIVLAQMREEAQRAHPRECCGILLGQGDRIVEIVATANIHATPETHFEIDPQALINAHRAAREGGPQVIGYYHSHPNGSAEPSATDRKLAANDGAIWAILSVETVTFWRSVEQGFVRLHYATPDG